MALELGRRVDFSFVSRADPFLCSCYRVSNFLWVRHILLLRLLRRKRLLTFAPPLASLVRFFVSLFCLTALQALQPPWWLEKEEVQDFHRGRRARQARGVRQRPRSQDVLSVALIVSFCKARIGRCFNFLLLSCQVSWRACQWLRGARMNATLDLAGSQRPSCVGDDGRFFVASTKAVLEEGYRRRGGPTSLQKVWSSGSRLRRPAPSSESKELDGGMPLSHSRAGE